MSALGQPVLLQSAARSVVGLKFGFASPHHIGRERDTAGMNEYIDGASGILGNNGFESRLDIAIRGASGREYTHKEGIARYLPLVSGGKLKPGQGIEQQIFDNIGREVVAQVAFVEIPEFVGLSDEANILCRCKLQQDIEKKRYHVKMHVAIDEQWTGGAKGIAKATDLCHYLGLVVGADELTGFGRGEMR